MASRLTKSVLIQALLAPTDGRKIVDVLPKIWFAEAVEDLIDLLRNESGPPERPFIIQINIIEVLGDLKDKRAVEPLLECYELYRALDDLILQTVKDAGGTVPSTYSSMALVPLLQKHGSPSLLKSSGYLTYARKIAGTHIKLDLEAESLVMTWMLIVWRLRSDIVRALEKIQGEEARELLRNLFEREGEKSVHEAIAEALARLRDPRAIETLGESLLSTIKLTTLLPDDTRTTIDLLAGYSDVRAREYLLKYCQTCRDRRKRELRKYAADKLDPTGQMPELADARKKSACFIATAAYGSDAMPQVRLLQEFRDTRLTRSRMGRAVVALYERLSPQLAELIRTRPATRAFVRVVILNRVVQILQRLRIVEAHHMPSMTSKARRLRREGRDRRDAQEKRVHGS